MRASFRCLSATAVASRSRTIGFIGLGAMGREMASNLLTKTFAAAGPSMKSNPVAFVVHDVHEPTVSNFLSLHAAADRQILHASSPSGVVRLASTVFTMLPSSPQVLDAYTDPELGILPSLESLPADARTETLCVDCTTLDQAVAKEVAGMVEGVGASMIDAPVSGGVVGAKEATLSFMCGGRENAFQRAEQYLALMGRRSVYCGASGNGLAAKIANNLLLGISMIGTAEAMLLGQSLGLSPQLLANIINTSTGRCWSSDTNNPSPGALSSSSPSPSPTSPTPGTHKSPPADRGWEGGFMSKLMSKDLGLAKAAMEGTGLALPLANVAERVYSKLTVMEEFRDKDFSVVYEWLRQGNIGLRDGGDARAALRAAVLKAEEAEDAARARSEAGKK